MLSQEIINNAKALQEYLTLATGEIIGIKSHKEGYLPGDRPDYLVLSINSDKHSTEAEIYFGFDNSPQRDQPKRVLAPLIELGIYDTHRRKHFNANIVRFHQPGLAAQLDKVITGMEPKKLPADYRPNAIVQHLNERDHKYDVDLIKYAKDHLGSFAKAAEHFDLDTIKQMLTETAKELGLQALFPKAPTSAVTRGGL